MLAAGATHSTIKQNGEGMQLSTLLLCTGWYGVTISNLFVLVVASSYYLLVGEIVGIDW